MDDVRPTSGPSAASAAEPRQLSVRFDGVPRPAKIPTIIHQSWKDERLPLRWASTVASVRRRHPGWQYRLWTDSSAAAYVREKHPDLYPAYAGCEREIMRCDIMRYVMMHDVGGLYCDLDYEFIRPYDYGDAEVVLGYEFERALGDTVDQVANFVFASAPGHPLWRDLLDELIRSPPRSRVYTDVVLLTGPLFLTRVFMQNQHRYRGVMLHPRITFNPFRSRGKHERGALMNNGVTVGVHHAFGSWKERWTPTYFKTKFAKLKRRWSA